MESCFYTGARIFHQDRLLRGFALEVSAGRTVALWREDDVPENATCCCLKGGILCAGFIETQANGGGGVLVNAEFDSDALAKVAQAHRQYGTVAILPTFITDSQSRYHQAIAAISDAVLHKVEGIIGGHFEGPFINPSKKGTHQVKFMRQPDEADYAVFAKHEAALQHSIVSVAPERLAMGTIARLKRHIPFIQLAHSMASHIEIERAYAEGLTGITHFYNAMPPLQGREPSVIGTAAALGLYAGIITDGIHSHPYALRSAYQLLGKDKLMLVTDSMHTIGVIDEMNEFDLLGIRVFVRGNRLVNEEGALAGAHITMLETVKNAMKYMELSQETALHLAITTPARYLNLPQLSHITSRKCEDVLYLDEEFDLIAFLHQLLPNH